VAWLSIRLSVASAQIEALCDALTAAGALSITLRDAADAPVLEPGPGETPLWPHAELDALFPLDADLTEVRARLTVELGRSIEHTSLDVRFIEDSDWSQTWRNHTVEYRFGGRLWVIPRDAAAPRGAAAVLRLDPGLAFGTGSHATTAMCLEWLATHPIDGWSVVDYGAGSGILGVAALLLGASYVAAVDHDEQARLATQANATYNDVAAQRLRIFAPDELATTPHDLVLANILAGPLMTLAPQLAALVRPGGLLVMSGLLEHQAGDVLERYPQFRFAQPVVRDSWVMLEGTKTGG
jgi:ribosomal protein L11 methyltransferase